MRTVLILGAAGTPEGLPPVWIAEHDGLVLVEVHARRCANLGAKLVLAMLKNEARRHHLDSIARLAAPDCEIVELSNGTQGAACTALMCIEHIDPDAELIIMNANELIDVDLAEVANEFRKRELDAGVTTFPSLHPRYSYVLLDEQDRVIQAAEKHPISRSAIAGFFWFRRGADFIQAVQDMIRKDVKVDDQFFISLTLNELVLNHKNIGTYPISPKSYHPLKSIRQVSQYEDL